MENAALIYEQGVVGSHMNALPGTRITSFFKALFRIISHVSLTPGTCLQKNEMECQEIHTMA